MERLPQFVARVVKSATIGFLAAAVALTLHMTLLGATDAIAAPDPSSPGSSSTGVQSPLAGTGASLPGSGSTKPGQADPNVVSRRISELRSDGAGQTAWTVLAADGTRLAGVADTTVMTPASTLKVLTGLLALDAMPAEQRFATRVTSPAPGSIVLVGGGDPSLTTNPVPSGYPRPASLAELADRTAAELKKQNQTTVSLGFDQSLFTGPDWQPTWEPVFETDVTRISALMADVGTINGQQFSRTKTPALQAATGFATLLRERGITVGDTLTPASGTGAELARVESLPLRVLIEHTLLHSDNTAADILLRHVAIASGGEASFTGGTTVAEGRLKGLGIWQDGAVLMDGSGVSRQNRVSPQMLAKAVHLALSNSKYQPLLDGLPVAGATGTLKDRFNGADAVNARGWVRAKTGSLRDTSALAGYARSADDQDLILVFMSNGFTNSQSAKAWIDRSASAVSDCGCR